MQEAILLPLLALAAAADPPPPEAGLETVAEASGYQATATHADVVGQEIKDQETSPIIF